MSDLVFMLELPLELAPVLNSYSTMAVKKRARLRKNIDAVVIQAKQSWRTWPMGIKKHTTGKVVRGKLQTKTTVTGGRKRSIRVTRYSSRKPDEISADIIGGKIAIDRLVQAEILRDDSSEWLKREAYWQQVPRGQGKVVIEVFEI